MKNFIRTFLVLLLFLSFIPIHKMYAFYLPDTGQTACYSNKGQGKVIPCPSPGESTAQDGSYTIRPPSFTVNPDGTVFDNNTWLMWQQQDDGVTRTWDEAKSYCDGLTLGGYSDWRLPEKKELESIINYGKYNPAIDLSVFPGTHPDNYWSSTIATCEPKQAWYVHFGSGMDIWDNSTQRIFYGGNLNYIYTSSPFYVRCVRGGPLLFGDFNDSGNGTVTDFKTGLMWQQDETRDRRGKIKLMKWGDSLSYCEGLSLGGYSDWRVPNIRELLSLIDEPALRTFFPNLQEASYWSSTPNSLNNDNRWSLSFTYGFTENHDKEYRENAVRCVRGGEQAFSLDDKEIRVEPSGLDFQYLRHGESRFQTLTVTNTGKDNLMIGTISGPSAPFFITYDGCSGKILPALMSCSITVKLYSLQEGTFTATMSIPSDDADNLNITVNLSGKVYGLTFLLPDTGQTTCYNDVGSVITCPSADQAFTQDGSYTINPPSFTLNDVTVIDNNTGLIWQRSDDGIVRTWDEANNYCENLALGGYSDWRLPTKRELFSIVDFGRYNPSINISIFPDTKRDKYWSSDVKSSSNEAWYVYFGKLEIDYGCASVYSYYKYDGVTVNSSDKSNKYYVRCVRGEQLPNTALVDNGDGTVTDVSTGLMWQKAESPPGQTWESAISYCEELSLAGFSDWRLPNIKELASLGDSQDNMIYMSAFSPDSCSGSGAYWSSTSIHYVVCSLFWVYQNAYIASLPDGLVFFEAKPYSDNRTTWSKNKARCVRGGNTLLDIWEISVNPLALNFGSVDVGRASFLSFTVSNIGRGDLVIGTITIPASPFSITSDGCSGKTLTGSASCSVTVGFSAVVEGTFDSIITIPSNDGDHPVVGVNLSAKASMPSGVLTGAVTDISTGLPLPNVTVTVTDFFKTHRAVTDSDGTYTITGVAQGNFSAIFEKMGYIKQTVSGTLASGESQTLNIRLTPLPPLTITITSPQNGAVLTSSPVIVTGSVSNNADVKVNGIKASVNNNIFTASIPLMEGQNTITASAIDQFGQTASHSIIVTLMVSGPPIISNIIISDITYDSATIIWTTDQPSDSVVEYGENISYSKSTTDSTLTTIHSIRLNRLIPSTTYHFRVISRNTLGTYFSEDMIFTTLTPPFTATTIGDYDNITVMEVTGDYDAINPDGSINTMPRQMVAKEFFRLHPDEYDFLVIFSNFDFQMPKTEAKAFYLEIKNDIHGIGKPIFDNADLYWSCGRLQGIIDMGNISNHGTNPANPTFEETLSILSHEQMHKWGASIKFIDIDGNISNALLGMDGAHWSFLLDADASVLYGNDWMDNKDSTFTSTGANKYYSALDLYLAGFYSRSQVPPMLLIDNPAIDPARLPEIGSTLTAKAGFVTVDDIIAAEGERIPDVSSSQKAFKTAFIFITRPGTFTGNEIYGIKNIRNAWAGRFAALTYGMGSIMDIAPSITISIASPSYGEMVYGPNITVRGAIINTTGNETGITVNGIPATVYGSQFTVNNVPLTEGQNTITVTATDTSGNTASTSITVFAITTGNYIRLASNINSGIAPLEVT
ncbi:MAG: DUF1566 domain-containing protein, partial [Candidatus Aenigmatarchaeota archaeon]